MRKNGMEVSLVVIGNALNINIAPIYPKKTTDKDYREVAFRILENFAHVRIIEQTINKMGKNPVLSALPIDYEEGESHKKMRHDPNEEIVIHSHLFFEDNVTPENLEKYLGQKLKGQESFRGKKEFQFFDEANKQKISNEYRTYYRNFVDSDSKQKFYANPARKLTIDEKKYFIMKSIFTDQRISKAENENFKIFSSETHDENVILGGCQIFSFFKKAQLKELITESAIEKLLEQGSTESPQAGCK